MASEMLTDFRPRRTPIAPGRLIRIGPVYLKDKNLHAISMLNLFVSRTLRSTSRAERGPFGLPLEGCYRRRNERLGIGFRGGAGR
jgi:hypothetical protein